MPTRTVANGGGNYNAIGTWVEGAVPTNLDDVVFTPTSGQLTVNVSSQAKTINFTNYTNTITFTAQLAVFGNINLGTGGYTQAGASRLQIELGTLTTNGVVWSRGFAFAGTAATFTLADNFNISGTLTIGGTTTTTINGNNIYASGSVTTSSTATALGTTVIVFTGNGTWSNSSTGKIQNNIIFNTTGTTVVSGTVRADGNSIVYSGGTVVATGSTIIAGTSTTFNTSTLPWGTVQFQGTSQTFTLLSDINCAAFTFNGTTSTIVNGAVNINVSGTVTINQAAHTVSPGASTPTIVLMASGNWTHASTSFMGLNVTINTSGTTTFGGNGMRLSNAGTLTHISGAIAGTTNLLVTSYRFNCPNLSWAALTTQSGTITLLDNLNISGGLIFQTNTQTINGLFNLNVGGGFVRQTSGAIGGTATIVLNGTGTWSDLFPTAQVAFPIIINTAGIITISGTIGIGSAGSITYVMGTMITTSSTLRINGSTTMDTSGMTWNNIAPVAGTITLSSQLNVSNQIGVLGSCTLAGNFGFNCGWLSISAAGIIFTLPPAITNTISTQMTSTIATLASRSSIVCSTVNGTKAIVVLMSSASQDNGYLSATDIDSSMGQPIYTYKGILTRTTNWNTLSTSPEKNISIFNSKVLSSFANLDSDAQSFIVSANINDRTQMNAVNQLVRRLKAQGLWTKMNAIYPFVGGNATAHSYNLKNTSQFQITFVNAITHNSNGVTTNGTNSYLNTNYAPSVSATLNDESMGLYSRTSAALGVAGTAIDMGCNAAGTVRSLLSIRAATGTPDYGTLQMNDSTVSLIQTSTNSDGSGLFVGSRISSTSLTKSRNGIVTNTSIVSNAGTLYNGNVYIGCRNNSTTAAGFVARNYAFAFMGKGLTNTDLINLNDIIQQYQTILGRKV